MRIVMLVPRRADGAVRDRNWAWIRDHWTAGLPEVEIVTGDHDDGPFNRSAAINAAARAAGDWDLAVIADADSFCGTDQLRRAINTAVRTGMHTIAFSDFRYLSQKMTDRIVLDGFNGDWNPGIEWTLKIGCSSLLAVPRAVWDAAGGFDEGFIGWGEEDIAFSIACQTMCPARYIAQPGGDHLQLRLGFHRLEGDCWHLWHPKQDTNDPKLPGYQANVARRERYVAAAHDPKAMRALLAELGVLHAAGGVIAADRPYLVGERGPETFIPSASGTITSRGEL
jgi:hypothetical protein